MSLFRRICLVIDSDWADNSGRIVCLVAVAPTFGVILLGNWWFVPSFAFAAILMLFSFWRLSVMARTGLVGGEVSDLPKMPND